MADSPHRALRASPSRRWSQSIAFTAAAVGSDSTFFASAARHATQSSNAASAAFASYLRVWSTCSADSSTHAAEGWRPSAPRSASRTRARYASTFTDSFAADLGHHTFSSSRRLRAAEHERGTLAW